jgi:hypothetical protein
MTQCALAGSLLVALALVASAAAATGSAARVAAAQRLGRRRAAVDVAVGGPGRDRRGQHARSTAPYWAVTIDAPATNSLTGQPTVAELGSSQWAQDVAARLTSAGYQPRVDIVAWPAFADTSHGAEGYRVRTGRYGTSADAQAAVASLKAAGFTTAASEWTGYDADQAPDAQSVHVAVIDPCCATGTWPSTPTPRESSTRTTCRSASPGPSSASPAPWPASTVRPGCCSSPLTVASPG